MKDGINSCTFKSDSTLEDQKKKQHKIAFSFLPDVREFTSDSDLLLSGKEPRKSRINATVLQHYPFMTVDSEHRYQ